MSQIFESLLYMNLIGNKIGTQKFLQRQYSNKGLWTITSVRWWQDQAIQEMLVIQLVTQLLFHPFSSLLIFIQPTFLMQYLPHGRSFVEWMSIRPVFRRDNFAIGMGNDIGHSAKQYARMLIVFVPWAMCSWIPWSIWLNLMVVEFSYIYMIQCLFMFFKRIVDTNTTLK